MAKKFCLTLKLWRIGGSTVSKSPFLSTYSKKLQEPSDFWKRPLDKNNDIRKSIVLEKYTYFGKIWFYQLIIHLVLVFGQSKFSLVEYLFFVAEFLSIEFSFEPQV